MTEITDLQARITAALDRIGTGLEGLGPGGGADGSAEVARLTEALEEERTANAQLEERVRTIKEKQDGTVQVLADEVERLRALLAAEEETVARLSRVNGELRANNTALREAIAHGVAEPHLVNKSMMVELEALRTAQEADRAELDAVLGELNALVADAARGADEEEAAHA
ncbi:MAG TPA: hypothetical protein DIU07_16005 [Rhodobacteraceae bacterium]|nr:hypothetical protein [Paracoccaceae bacterium]